MALYGHGYDEKALPFPLKAYGALTNMSDLLAFWGIRIQRQRFRPHRPRKDSEAMWMSMAVDGLHPGKADCHTQTCELGALTP